MRAAKTYRHIPMKHEVKIDLDVLLEGVSISKILNSLLDRDELYEEVKDFLETNYDCTVFNIAEMEQD